MDTVNFLAQLWGFSLVIIAMALLLKQKNMHRLFALVENEAVLFLAGIINVIFGVALILAYNVWAQQWQVIITILGWLVLARGLVILFYPEAVHKAVAKIKAKNDWMMMVLVAAVLLGCFLLYMGFTA